MPQRTPLYRSHIDSGGKMVEFSDWQLPIHYGSLITEHQSVRQDVGMFDVSHMTIVDINGADSTRWLQKLLSNDVSKLGNNGDALYSCMLNLQGGIIDDLIVYLIKPSQYRLIVNAATRQKDLDWMAEQANGFDITISERGELAMIAVQGPNSRSAMEKAAYRCDLVDAPVAMEKVDALSRYQACEVGGLFIAATGYTGEDGYEIAASAARVNALWNSFLEIGVQPCGLGARDTLRLEAGMSLYGHDMDESTTPYSSALGWSVAWQPEEREFNGRDALISEYETGAQQKLCGFVLDEKGVLREGQLLWSGDEKIGVVTSGTFSPTLKKSIAFGRVVSDHNGDCEVEIRKNRLPVRMTSRVFVRNGKAVL